MSGRNKSGFNALGGNFPGGHRPGNAPGEPAFGQSTLGQPVPGQPAPGPTALGPLALGQPALGREVLNQNGLSHNLIARVLSGGAMTTGFAVLDCQTTGFSSADRILEIGVVLLSAAGKVEKRWRTLIQPDRTFTNSYVHHLQPSDVVGAPRFGDVAKRLAELLDSRILVAHNAPFERRFLSEEFARLGIELPSHLWLVDTQRAAQQLLPGTPSRLASCLASAGVANPVASELAEAAGAAGSAGAAGAAGLAMAANSALAEALATAALFNELLRRDQSILAGARPLSFTAQQYAALAESSIPLVARADGAFADALEDNVTHQLAPQRVTTAASQSTEAEWLRRLAKQVPDTGDEKSDRYFAFVAEAMIDGRLSASELAKLQQIANEYGLTAQDVAELHEHFLTQLVIEAWADGVLTAHERAWLGRIAQQLAIEPTRFQQLLAQPGREAAEAGQPGLAGIADKLLLAPGDRVSFLGQLVTPRESWIARARTLGLDVGGLAPATRVVVTADVGSSSPLVTTARELGVSVVDEATFARSIASLATSQSASATPAIGAGSAAVSFRPPVVGALFDESNTIAPLSTLLAVFPWLREIAEVAPVRGDTVGIADYWIIGHAGEPLVKISPALTSVMQPMSAQWQAVYSQLAGAGDYGLGTVTAQELSSLEGIGRVRLQKLVSAVVLRALDEHEAQVAGVASGVNAGVARSQGQPQAGTAEGGARGDDRSADEHLPIKVVRLFGLENKLLTADGELRPGVAVPEIMQAINVALELAPDSSRRKTVRRLWDRGEDELAALVKEL